MFILLNTETLQSNLFVSTITMYLVYSFYLVLNVFIVYKD